MSEWLPELFAFYRVPVAIGCIYVIAAAAVARTSRSRTILGLLTGIAIFAMFTIARAMSGPTILLGNIPGLQEWVGSFGIAAAGAALLYRSRQRAEPSSIAVDCAVGIAIFLLVVLLPVGVLLMLMSMNPD